MCAVPYGRYLKILGEELAQQNVLGEILLANNFTLLLDVFLQDMSMDIETYFKPAKILLETAEKVAHQEGLSDNWLIEASKEYARKDTLSSEFIHQGLHMYFAPIGYLLTMFLFFGDQQLSREMRELMELKNIFTSKEAFQCVEAYLPKRSVPSKIQERIEQIFFKEKIA